MIGSNIKRLRTERGLTQKALADQLFVSAQAVSRWENNEVEPSINTITEMAKIFGVSTDEILGLEPPKSKNNVKDDERSETKKEPPPPPPPKNEKNEPPKYRTVLTLCTECNDPIYIKEDIVRLSDKTIICKKCNEKKLRKEEMEREEQFIYDTIMGKRRRTISFVVSAIIVLIGFILTLTTSHISTLFGSIAISCWASCLILKNNFVGDMSLGIFAFSFVKFPGIIFSFGIDGCLFFIGIKILFAILGILLALLCVFLVIVIGSLVSLFVYPYAIYKNFKDPTYTRELFDF